MQYVLMYNFVVYSLFKLLDKFIFDLNCCTIHHIPYIFILRDIWLQYLLSILISH